jgi:hypothetical protein
MQIPVEDYRDIVSRSVARTGIIQHLYYQVFEEAYLSFRDSEAELRVLEKQRTEPPSLEKRTELDRQIGRQASRTLPLACKSVVFAAMCLEAAIYDFAAWHLGDKYTVDHLDKLDFKAKWVVIPKLILKHDLVYGRPSMDPLNVLTKGRNKLVHYKSVEVPMDNPEAELKVYQGLLKRNEEIYAAAHAGFRVIAMISLDISELYGRIIHNPLPRFSKKDPALAVGYAAALEEVVSRCRQINAGATRAAEAAKAAAPFPPTAKS